MQAHSATPSLYIDKGTGSTVVLIHGSLCDYRYWRWQIDDLSCEHRVIAPSLAGYWPTLDTQHFDARFQATQLLQQLNALIGATHTFHVLGHSRGAVVALLLAELAPTRIRSLSLADPGLLQTAHAPVHTYLHDACDRVSKGQTDAGLAVFVDAVNGQGTWQHMVRWFKEMVRDNASTLFAQSQEQHYQIDLSSLAKTVHCPMLLIAGQHSLVRYTACIAQLKHFFPHAYEVTIAHAAHGMNLANPKAFNQSLLRFLHAVDHHTARLDLKS